MRIAGFLSCLALCLTIAVPCRISAQLSKAVNPTDTPYSIVTPVLDAKIPPERNLLYCAAFQLAWDELRQNLKPSLPDAPTAILALDKRLVGKPDLPEDACFALGSLGGGLPDKIRAEVRKKFGAAAPPLDDLATTLAAYALLVRNLQFQQEFTLHEKPLIFSTNGTPFAAAAFGIDPDKGAESVRAKMRAQVRVIDYNPKTSEFVVRLQSRSQDDEIILARVSPETSLLQTIEAVSARIAKGEAAALAAGDILAIPRISLAVRHVFPEISRYVGAMAGRPASAVQQIHFTLGEKSSALKSEGRTPSSTRGRELMFDRPFLLWLRKTSSRYPYLALWVGHPEILQAAGTPPKAASIAPAVSAPASASSAAKAGLDGRALVETRCADCHPLSKVYGAKHTSAQWAATVKRMVVSRGAKLTAAEQKAVVDYLSSR